MERNLAINFNLSAHEIETNTPQTTDQGVRITLHHQRERKGNLRRKREANVISLIAFFQTTKLPTVHCSMLVVVAGEPKGGGNGGGDFINFTFFSIYYYYISLLV